MENTKRFKLLRVLGKTILYSWKMLDQWRMYLFYAILLTIISLIFGRWSFSCIQEPKAWCHSFSGSAGKDISYLLLYYFSILVIFSSFGYDLYNATFKNTVFKIRNLLAYDKNRIKSIFFSIGCLMVFVIPIFIAIMIIMKPANPLFEIEFLFFIMLFCCVIFNVMYIRLMSFVAYYLYDYKMPSLKLIYSKTSGQTYVSVTSFLLLAVFLCFTQLQFIGNFLRMNENDTFLMSLTTEFLDYIIKLIYFSFFLAVFSAQKDLLEEDGTLPAEKAPEEPKIINKTENFSQNKKITKKSSQKNVSRKPIGRKKKV